MISAAQAIRPTSRGRPNEVTTRRASTVRPTETMAIVQMTELAMFASRARLLSCGMNVKQIPATTNPHRYHGMRTR